MFADEIDQLLLRRRGRKMFQVRQRNMACGLRTLLRTLRHHRGLSCKLEMQARRASDRLTPVISDMDIEQERFVSGRMVSKRGNRLQLGGWRTDQFKSI